MSCMPSPPDFAFSISKLMRNMRWSASTNKTPTNLCNIGFFRCDISRERGYVHEGYFQPVGNLSDNGALRKEAKELPPDLGRERRYKDAE